jgi:hypothetical protein
MTQTDKMRELNDCLLDAVDIALSIGDVHQAAVLCDMVEHYQARIANSGDNNVILFTPRPRSPVVVG